MYFKLKEQSFALIIIKFFFYLYGISFFLLGAYNIVEYMVKYKIVGVVNNYLYFIYLLLGVFLIYSGIRIKIKYFYFSIDKSTIKYFLNKKEGEIIIFFNDIISFNIHSDILVVRFKDNTEKQINLKKINANLSYIDGQLLKGKLNELTIVINKSK